MSIKNEKAKKIISSLVGVCAGYYATSVLAVICPAAGAIAYIGQLGISQLVGAKVTENTEKVIETLEEVIQK